jgi:hypothetical protein
MPNADPPPLACLDANVFLAVLIPEATKASKVELAGVERVLKAFEKTDGCMASPPLFSLASCAMR